MTDERPRYGIRVTGPDSDPDAGWAVRNGIGPNCEVLVGTVKSLKNAEKNFTEDEAFETALMLATQRPHLIGRLRVMRLRHRKDRGGRWTAEAECTP
jgi:hypothetical protein